MNPVRWAQLGPYAVLVVLLASSMAAQAASRELGKVADEASGLSIKIKNLTEEYLRPEGGGFYYLLPGPRKGSYLGEELLA